MITTRGWLSIGMVQTTNQLFMWKARRRLDGALGIGHLVLHLGVQLCPELVGLDPVANTERIHKSSKKGWRLATGCSSWVPKKTRWYSLTLWSTFTSLRKIVIFNGKTHYQWPCSSSQTVNVYQRLNLKRKNSTPHQWDRTGLMGNYDLTCAV